MGVADVIRCSNPFIVLVLGPAFALGVKDFELFVFDVNLDDVTLLHMLTVVVVRFEIELDTRTIHMLNELLVRHEKLFDKFRCLLAVGAICYNATAKVITGFLTLANKAVKMFLNGSFLGVGMTEVDFVGESFTRGKVFHEREITVPVETSVFRNFFLCHKLAVGWHPACHPRLRGTVCLANSEEPRSLNLPFVK